MPRSAHLLAGLFALSACTGSPATGDGGTDDDAGRLPNVEEPACERFDLRGDLAIDKASGLQWSRFVELTFASHAEAKARCEATGMRLPKRRELETLLEPGRRACELPCGFQGHGCATLLCDSEIPGTGGDHCGVAFNAGALVAVPADAPEGFVCVLDP